MAITPNANEGKIAPSTRTARYQVIVHPGNSRRPIEDTAEQPTHITKLSIHRLVNVKITRCSTNGRRKASRRGDWLPLLRLGGCDLFVFASRAISCNFSIVCLSVCPSHQKIRGKGLVMFHLWAEKLGKFNQK